MTINSMTVSTLLLSKSKTLVLMFYFSLTAGGDSASWSTKANDTTVAYINVCQAVGEAHGCNPTAGVCLKKVGGDYFTDVRTHYTVYMHRVCMLRNSQSLASHMS